MSKLNGTANGFFVGSKEFWKQTQKIIVAFSFEWKHNFQKMDWQSEKLEIGKNKIIRGKLVSHNPVQSPGDDDDN